MNRPEPMPPLISRRHPFKFYFSIIFGAGAISSIGLAMIYIYQKETIEHPEKSGGVFMPVVGVGLWLMAIYLVIRYYKNAPVIKLYLDHFTISKHAYDFTEVENIRFTGKQSFPFIIGHPMEATTIFFKNGTQLILFDEMYANSADIKNWLRRYALAQQMQPVKKVDAAALDTELFTDVFKGHPVLNLRGILMWAALLFFPYLLLSDKNGMSTGGTIATIIVCTVWFTLTAFQMNYFKVTDRHLIIANHYLFRKKAAFAIQDIEELVFETRYKQPNLLRVITKDLRHEVFPAASLRDSHWLAFKAKMEGRGIIVRNECI